MSIFACGFNAFSQVSSSRPDGSGSSSVVDVVVKPIAVDEDHLRKVKDRSEFQKENSADESRTVSKLKTVIISWDRISYFWDSGEVSSVGGPQFSTLVSREVSQIPNPFHGMKLKSLSSARQKLFGVDSKGHCFIFSPDYGTVPVQLCHSEACQDINIVEIAACEIDPVLLRLVNNSVLLGELQNEKFLLLRPLNFDLRVKSVSCGKHHVLLISVIGIISSFGNGSQGQLGHGTISSESQPRILEALEGVSIIQIAAGGWHSMALSDIGDVYVWGWNEKGQLGYPCRNLQLTVKKSPSGVEETPLEIGQETGTNMSASNEGIRDADDGFVNIQPFPVVLDILVGDQNDVFVSNIACGSRHSAAVLENGRAFSWGFNDYGQLGHGDTISRDHPQLIQFFVEHDILVDKVFGGFWNTVFVTREE